MQFVYSFFSFSVNLQPMEKSTDVYERLCQYVKNTHAATHQQYTLDVMDVSVLSLQVTYGSM